MKIECPWCDRPISLDAKVRKGQKNEESFTLCVEVDDEAGLLKPVTTADLTEIEGLEKLVACPVVGGLGVYSLKYIDKDGDIVDAKIWVVEK